MDLQYGGYDPNNMAAVYEKVVQYENHMLDDALFNGPDAALFSEYFQQDEYGIPYFQSGPEDLIAMKAIGPGGQLVPNPAGMLAFRNAFPDLIEKMLVSLNDRPLGDLGAGTFVE